MKMCRRTINSLAAAEGLLGAVIVLGIAMGFLQTDLGKIAHDDGIPYGRVLFVSLAAALVLSGVAFVYLRAALRYFKWHDRKTATSVAAVFCVSLVFVSFFYFRQFFVMPKAGDFANALSFFGLEALVMGSAWMLYRFVLKRVAARAFPDALARPAHS